MLKIGDKVLIKGYGLKRFTIAEVIEKRTKHPLYRDSYAVTRYRLKEHMNLFSKERLTKGWKNEISNTLV